MKPVALMFYEFMAALAEDGDEDMSLFVESPAKRLKREACPSP